MELEVIGAGFGRTGTLSLKMALEQLGLGPCYHMIEVGKNEGHAARWARAAEDEPVDWRDLFADYRSTVDWPSTYFWRELVDAYPRAKVILSLRSPESWYRSVRNTIYKAMMSAPADADPSTQGRMARRLVLEKTFDGRFEDEAYAREVFERHNAEVKATVSPHRLLVFEASQGWGPLCAFLGVAVPQTGYPQVNSTEDFETHILREIREQAESHRQN